MPRHHPGNPASRVTIADVARQAGVSIATVSRVLNTSGPVIPETQVRVRAAISQLGYSPQAAARNLASQCTHAIGLLLPVIGGDFFSLMLNGVEAEVNRSGYDLLIATFQPDRGPRIYSTPLGKHNTDGVIIFTDPLFDTTIHHFYEAQFPIVLLYQSAPEQLPIPSVTIENKDGSRKLIDHLIDVHGYRRIGFLRGPDRNEDSFWRERGYRESMELHGITINPQWIAEGAFTEDISYNAVMHWVKSGNLREAIYAGSDEGAMGTYLALNQAGKRIPEDVAVVGFDDMSLARYLTPPLTTIKAPTEKVGRMAVRQLIRVIRTGSADPLSLLPTELVIRQSCGCK